jgi:hypothetical protein
MSDQFRPGGSFRIDDVAVVTLRSTGAIRFAPRTLTCWIARDHLSVRSSTGELIWIEDTTPAATAPSARNAGRSPLIDPTAPEATAVRDLNSVCSWLGLDARSLAPGEPVRHLDRPAIRYAASNDKFVATSMIEDDESGAILQVLATSADFGALRLEVTDFMVVPWRADYFEPGN